MARKAKEPGDASVIRDETDAVRGIIRSNRLSKRPSDKEPRADPIRAGLDRKKIALPGKISSAFQNSLTVLLGSLEESLADREHSLTLAHRDRLELAHRQSLHLLKLVDTLLQLSQLEAGRVPAFFQPTDLGAETEKLANAFRSPCIQAGLQLKVDCAPLPKDIHVDRAMWEKIVLNLLSNALKFTFKGEIHVALHRVNGHAQLKVSDTGTGIPPAVLPRIFERFHGFRDTRARSHEGAGAGLALVRELVKLHGGSISVESTLGRGSVFTVTIPRGKKHLPPALLKTGNPAGDFPTRPDAYVEEAWRWLSPDDLAPRPPETKALGQPATESPAGTSSNPARSRSRILLCAANKEMRDFLARLLSERWEVEAVANGRNALAAMRARSPNLVLTDATMPGMDGNELLRRLRSDPRTRSLPVIFLATRADETASHPETTAAADDYLLKPFTVRELFARINLHLELARWREATETLSGENENRFRRLADTIPTLIWMSGPDKKCTWFNKSWLDFVGQSMAAAQGHCWTKNIHPDDLAASLKTYRSAFDARQSFSLECRLQRDDRAYRWILNNGIPTYGLDGTFTGYIGSGVDITGQKQHEAELKEADLRKDEFLAMLAHELRNPLAPIRTAVEVLNRHGPSTPLLDDARAIIIRQVEHLSRLVDDLLDVSRITSGRIMLKKQRIELAMLVNLAVETCRPLLSAKQQELMVTLPAAAVYLHGDPMRLAQVITNLLGNASKFTGPKGKIQLTAETKNGVACLRIRDNGLGLSKEMLVRIFDLFAQANGALDRTQGGLGIGLTLVKKLVELHGGMVAATSEGEGKGSEFIVRLPLDVLPAAVEQPPSRKIVSPPPPRRILVVDDKVDGADSLAMLLRLEGHQVQTANDGPAAIDAVRSFNPDIALLDIGLPGMSGYEVAKRLRREPGREKLLLVALTGYGQPEDRSRSKEAGFDFHLVKPASPEALASILRH